MNSEKMLKTKLPKGMIFENQARLGAKPNWKIIKPDIKKYPSFLSYTEKKC